MFNHTGIIRSIQELLFALCFSPQDLRSFREHHKSVLLSLANCFQLQRLLRPSFIFRNFASRTSLGTKFQRVFHNKGPNVRRGEKYFPHVQPSHHHLHLQGVSFTRISWTFQKDFPPTWSFLGIFRAGSKKWPPHHATRGFTWASNWATAAVFDVIDSINFKLNSTKRCPMSFAAGIFQWFLQNNLIQSRLWLRVEHEIRRKW